MGSNSLLFSAILIETGEDWGRAYLNGITFGPSTGLPSDDRTIFLHSTVKEYSPDGAPSSAPYVPIANEPSGLTTARGWTASPFGAVPVPLFGCSTTNAPLGACPLTVRCPTTGNTGSWLESRLLLQPIAAATDVAKKRTCNRSPHILVGALTFRV
jgi:hypothetical protein